MEAKHQIFISSTYLDLQDERRSVMEQIINMGNIPVGMELFQASNDTQWDYIKKRIEDCDYFIVIIAERYGTADDSGKSFTRKEYEYAVNCGIPVAAFLLDSQARQSRLAAYVEHEKKTEIDSFRALVSQRLCKYWMDPRDLAIKANNTLRELSRDFPRPGWVKADDVRFKNLDSNAPDSRETSAKLMAAVERDLADAGYYRKDQILHIRIDETGAKPKISLDFKANIVPNRAGAFVFHPTIDPPKGASKIYSEYRVGTKILNEGGVARVYDPIEDHLFIQYEVADDSFVAISDLHLWPSPVLNYFVRFDRSDRYLLEVSKALSQCEEAILPAVSVAPEKYLEFTGRGAAFTGQGIKWALSKPKVKYLG